MSTRVRRGVWLGRCWRQNAERAQLALVQRDLELAHALVIAEARRRFQESDRGVADPTGMTEYLIGEGRWNDYIVRIYRHDGLGHQPEPLRAVLLALAILTLGQALAGCGPAPLAAPGALPRLHLAMPALAPPPSSRPAMPATEPPRAHDERASWCEPLDPPLCRSSSDCDAGQRCVSPWWAATHEAKVCARPWPTRAEQRWQAERLRVVVDHVCDRSRGCDPNDLHAYLRTLVGRESSWRAWKRHRLGPDIEANADAWIKHRQKFATNPASANADRWMTGLGYYAQIPALWLPRWDADAPPETLCGEVESTEAHLRGARDQVRKIRRGVDCDRDGEREFFGTACEPDAGGCSPSWYDVSRANSGSLCPGDLEHRQRFETRARSLGLDPWAPVVPAQLGAAIPLEQQDEIAAQLRERMDALD